MRQSDAHIDGYACNGCNVCVERGRYSGSGYEYGDGFRRWYLYGNGDKHHERLHGDGIGERNKHDDASERRFDIDCNYLHEHNEHVDGYACNRYDVCVERGRHSGSGYKHGHGDNRRYLHGNSHEQYDRMYGHGDDNGYGK